jgi:hypothetical protein
MPLTSLGPHPECLHQDRWDHFSEEIDEIKTLMRRDTTATWVRWALPLVATAVLGVYADLNVRIVDHNKADVAFQADSMSDRRQLSQRQGEMDARQREQYDRILSELSYLRSRIDK